MSQPRQLGRRFLLAGVFLGGANWATYAVNFTIQIFLARLLGPESFGLYAFVLAINEFLNIVGAFSLSVALIQDPEESQSRYDTALVISLGLALVGLLAAGAVAPFLAASHGSEAAWFLLTLAGARFFVLGQQVPQAMLERRLRYGAVSATTAIGGTLPNVLALALAWQGVGAWCLVIRDVAVGALQLAVGWAWSGYRFRGRVSREGGARLMAFARKLFVARTLEILFQRLDRLVVGLFLGNAATGLYDRARFLSEAGLLVTRPFAQLSLNLYARTQDDPARLNRSFELVHPFLSRTMLAGAATLVVFPAETVRLILGDEWLEAAPVLRWLGLYGGVFPLLVNLRHLFIGIGAVTLTIRVTLVQVGCLVPGILVAGWLGSLEGVAASLLAATLVSLGVAWSLRGEYLEGAGRERPVGALLLAAVTLGLLAASAAGWLDAVPWAARPFLPPLAFALGALAVEGRSLLAEVRYLRSLLATRGPD